MLAMVILVPLFFNVHSQRVFEGDKIALMRSIALLMGAVWLLRSFLSLRAGMDCLPHCFQQTRAVSRPQLLKNPIIITTLLFGMSCLLSTLFSVAPHLSIPGSYNRLQGIYTFMSYIFFFFLVIRIIRTRERLELLLTALILAGFPIALYGILQHFEMDPLIWAKNVSKRVSSSMGNPIFLGGYLIMVLPLTLSRLLENWGKATGPVTAPDVFAGLGTACLPAAGLLAGVLMAPGETAFWFRWAGLLAGLCLQIPCYLFFPRKRFQTILVVSVPLTFGFLACLAWIFELFFPPANPYHFWMGLSTLLISTLA
ncbi:MAG: hypothetical protein JRK53_22375, partial [Deltaproteobacteria bacterium]|nr:hypothetical protein [Deltaproteobacteria bacterium]